MLSLVTTRMLSSTSHQRVDTGGHVHTSLKIGAQLSRGHRAAIWCADGERRIGDQETRVTRVPGPFRRYRHAGDQSCDLRAITRAESNLRHARYRRGCGCGENARHQ